MICSRCIRRSALPLRHLRSFTNSPHPSTPTTSPPLSSPSTSTAGSTAPSFTPAFASVVGTPAKGSALPVSSCVEGTVLKGLNYLKNRDDPVALKEEEYPEWLWRCLDKKVVVDELGDGEGDEFSKSAKVRRKAAKIRRRAEERALASGDTTALDPKIPIQKQSIDLPGAGEEALEKREELRGAMRRERRKGIKTSNYLKGM